MLNTMPRLRIAIATTVVMLVARPAKAHRDARLALQDDGAIEGLPAKYSPAILSFERDAARNVSGVVLRLSGGEYRFPKCMLGLFEEHQRVELFGSWYHRESILPYYLSVRIPNEGRAKASFSLLFNLRTAQLLKVDKIVSVRDGIYTSKSEHIFEKLCPGKNMVDGWKGKSESSKQ